MTYSDNTMAAILLSTGIAIKDDSVKPLSLGQWNTLIQSCIEKNIHPGKIVSDTEESLKALEVSDEIRDRIVKLLERSGGVAFELDSYNVRGIKVVSEFDREYPVLLRRKLKNKKPPVLFYAGDITLASKMGVAIVGSRGVGTEGFDYTKEIARKVAGERMVIYSGGAKGVDSIASATALECGGGVVEFIADSLVSKIKKKEVADKITAGKLLVMTDMKPDAGFASWRAMNRNKYIYAASCGAFIVEADLNKGGTWEGAKENQKNGWVPNFIWDNKKLAGNQKLIEDGNFAYVLSEDKICDLITSVDVTEMIKKSDKKTVKSSEKASGQSKAESIKKNDNDENGDISGQMDIFSYMNDGKK